MKSKTILWTAFLALLIGLTATAAAANEGSDLARLRAATARFHQAEAAQAAGWDLVPGLDHCFNNPGVGAMGYHYINVGMLDTEVVLEQPEAMVYAPGEQGQLHLAAVEYIVPAGAWDATGATEPPVLYGRSFHLNENLGVYVLHVWTWKHNPAGLFEDWNPWVSCP